VPCPTGNLLLRPLRGFAFAEAWAGSRGHDRDAGDARIRHSTMTPMHGGARRNRDPRLGDRLCQRRFGFDMLILVFMLGPISPILA